MDFENLTLMSHLWNSRAHFSTDSVETRSKPCSVVLSHKRLDKFFSSYLGIALLFSHVMSPSSRLSWACIFECRYKSCEPSTQIDGEEGCQFPATTAKLTLLCPCFCFCVCVCLRMCVGMFTSYLITSDDCSVSTFFRRSPLYYKSHIMNLQVQ